MREKNGIILYIQHNHYHICVDKLFKKISEEYIGIKREIVREYIQKCEAFKMNNSFKGLKRLSYITAQKIHERLFLDIIDLKKMSRLIMVINIFSLVSIFSPNSLFFIPYIIKIAKL
ncbi:hypothetical protein DMUE_6177 [Dictyocoela muelleri]|nr:hypothetical protein DMUE_6177 [Dictyocoela muelleri]